MPHLWACRSIHPLRCNDNPSPWYGLGKFDDRNVKNGFGICTICFFFLYLIWNRWCNLCVVDP